MLTLSHFYSDDHENVSLFTWEVEKRFPLSCSVPHMSYEILAQGPELELIRTNVKGIRMHDGPNVKWTGDDARFIVDYLATISEELHNAKERAAENS